MIKKYIDFINENKSYDDYYITYDIDKYVYHITSKSCEINIKENGFKTGKELDVCEKRSAVYFADKDVNYGIYARNGESETYEGQDIGEVKVNIKGLKLLNMTYKDKTGWANHKLYSGIVTRGELEKIPLDIDGTISFLDDGRIYEVCLKKDVANKLLN
ncbi:hypothetical protein M0Q50_03665 [bacterium]|jgi:hypothetical protein|nr:hypothetical protein [bacterium]